MRFIVVSHSENNYVPRTKAESQGFKIHEVTTADEKMANLSRQLTLLQKDNHETERLAEMEEKVSGGID
jgi:hypothetical protein